MVPVPKINPSVPKHTLPPIQEDNTEVREELVKNVEAGHSLL
jgi:hypothetical protein